MNNDSLTTHEADVCRLVSMTFIVVAVRKQGRGDRTTPSCYILWVPTCH